MGDRLRVELFGSLGHTGRGHGTDSAVILGLCGLEPATLDPDAVSGLVATVRQHREVTLPSGVTVALHPDSDLVFHKRARLPYYSNGMRFTLLAADGTEIVSSDFYSVGGGFVVNADEAISGAEVGCQGEVGVACSMAAAGLAAVRGGTVSQVENAAEIGMEHNLGLTCDPVGGLVQIPCIERNAMGAVKAINASRLALRGDMKTKYKETSRGGLAVNVIEC